LPDVGDPEEKKRQQAGDIQPAAVRQLNEITDILLDEEGQHAPCHDQDESDDEVEAGIQSCPYPLRKVAQDTGVEQQIGARQ
jgi:hypothetical protein